jgi:hypothetical protein
MVLKVNVSLGFLGMFRGESRFSGIAVSWKNSRKEKLSKDGMSLQWFDELPQASHSGQGPA